MLTPETPVAAEFLERAADLRIVENGPTQLGVPRLTQIDYDLVLNETTPKFVRFSDSASRSKGLSIAAYYPPTEDTKGLFVFDALQSNIGLSSKPSNSRHELITECGHNVVTLADTAALFTVYEIPSVEDFKAAFMTINGAYPSEMGVPVFAKPQLLRGRVKYVKGVGNGEHPYGNMEEPNFHDLIDHGPGLLFFAEVCASAKKYARSVYDYNPETFSRRMSQFGGSTVDYIDSLLLVGEAIRFNDDDVIDSIDAVIAANIISNTGNSPPYEAITKGAKRAASWLKKLTGRDVPVELGYDYQVRPVRHNFKEAESKQYPSKF